MHFHRDCFQLSGYRRGKGVLFVANSSVEWGHVQRTMEEENGRLATARIGVRLATAKAVR